MISPRSRRHAAMENIGELVTPRGRSKLYDFFVPCTPKAKAAAAPKTASTTPTEAQAKVKASPKDKAHGNHVRRGSKGTFAGRSIPRTERRCAVFKAILKEYSDSKTWAKTKHMFKVSRPINGQRPQRVYWRTAKSIMDQLDPEEALEDKMLAVRSTWRSLLLSKFT